MPAWARSQLHNGLKTQVEKQRRETDRGQLVE
jgi:hypothetical protein